MKLGSFLSGKRAWIILLIFLLLIYSLITSLFMYISLPKNYEHIDYMLDRRSFYSTTMLDDEKILIIGGDEDYAGTAEIYDPHTGISVYTGSLNIPRIFHSSILLDDGKVFVAGGVARNPKKYGDEALLQTEIYNPKTGRFSMGPKSSIPIGYEPNLIKLKNGNILLLGRRTIQIFDYKKNKFIINISKMDCYFDETATSMTLMSDGNVMLLGNFVRPNHSSEYYSCSTLIYNPTTQKISRGPSMVRPKRKYIKTIVLNNRYILALNGVNYNGQGNLNNIEIYDKKMNEFKYLGKLNVARSQYNPAVLLPNGNIYFYGEDVSPLRFKTKLFLKPTCEIFNPETGQSTYTKICPSYLKYNSDPYLLKNGKLVLVGGGNPNIVGTDKTKEIVIIDTREVE